MFPCPYGGSKALRTKTDTLMYYLTLKAISPLVNIPIARRGM